MVNRDGKGPESEGPRTGRGLGNCKIGEPEEFFNFGRRLGRRRFLDKNKK